MACAEVALQPNAICPSCDTVGEVTSVFYISGVPTQSAVLLHDAEAAKAFPKGDLDLSWCGACGLAFNAAFDATLVDYSTGYEVAQGLSPTFRAFANRIAEDWITKYDLQGGHILEIGCGDGAFLKLLCELGGCQGTGYDPALNPSQNAKPLSNVTLIPENFGETHVPVAVDFIVCRHTLEHIGDIKEFLSLVRSACGDQYEIRLGFEVPDLRRILEEGAFWDIYYEHAAYFTRGSLARAFIEAGFEVLRVRGEYGDQYLLIDAAPSAPTKQHSDNNMPDDLEDTRRLIEGFKAEMPKLIDGWRKCFKTWADTDKNVALWGSGSKTVGFLTSIGDFGVVDCVVDINPLRHGAYMPGLQMPIISKEDLGKYSPDIVIVMNPIYRDEIQADITALGFDPSIFTSVTPPTDMVPA